jgi:hypothetical protein
MFKVHKLISWMMIWTGVSSTGRRVLLCLARAQPGGLSTCNFEERWIKTHAGARDKMELCLMHAVSSLVCGMSSYFHVLQAVTAGISD